MIELCPISSCGILLYIIHVQREVAMSLQLVFVAFVISEDTLKISSHYSVPACCSG